MRDTAVVVYALSVSLYVFLSANFRGSPRFLNPLKLLKGFYLKTFKALISSCLCKIAIHIFFPFTQLSINMPKYT